MQEQLAARLGVSRQPIQQAMVLLKNDGLVEELGRRGLFVAPLDLNMMQQHYEIRAALDGLAARLAAERASISSTIAYNSNRIGQATLEAGTAAVNAADIKLMVQRDIEFHQFIYEVSGNPLLKTTTATHWRYLRRVMGDVVRLAEPGPSLWEQHRDILNAILEGDAPASESRAIQHVRLATERLTKVFSQKALNDD